MHQGIDLSRFKKVSSDKKTTTLRHARGHEIKIAHSALTPKMKEQIESMGQHDDADRKMYADSDEEVSADDDAPVEDSSPEEASAPEAPPEQVMPPQQAQPAPSAPAQQPVQAPTMDQPVSQGMADYLKQHDAATQSDLDRGYIKPETFHDLYEKKDTLGKIGMIFGLIAGGAGAGLTGGPNVALDMMNNQIKNDLDAQVRTVGNRQTLYKINLDHQLNDANIVQKKKEGLLTDAQAKMTEQEAKTKAYALTNMQMNRITFHKLIQHSLKLPPGSPERQQAEQTLSMMSKAVDSENYDIADRTEAASMLGRAAFGQTAGGQDPEAGFQANQTALRVGGKPEIAEVNESRHMPGVEGKASRPLTSSDHEAINSGLTFQRQMDDFINWTKKHSGDLNPAERKEGIAKAASLQAAYRAASNGGVYKEGEQHFIGKIINDVPTVFLNKIRVLPSLTAVKQDSATQLDQRLKSLGFKGYKGSEKVADSGGGKKVREKSTGKIGYIKNGKFVEAGK